MRLGYVTLYVKEVKDTRDWYVDNIGLSQAWGSEDFCLLEGEGGAQLGLHRGAPLSDPGKVQLHFEVPDVDQTYERLRRDGLEFRQEPTHTDWGYRVATLRDPAGHTVEIYTQTRGS